MNNLFLILLSLGMVQGVAEFLPISSSAHLVIMENIDWFHYNLALLGKNVNLFINVALHVATLLAVFIYLSRDIWRIIKGSISGIIKKDFKAPELLTARNILIASIPAGVVGLLLNDFFEAIFASATSAFIFLIINGFILIYTKKIPVNSRKIEETGIIRSFAIGFFQAFAIMPGISRSGMTIAGGMFNGLEPTESAKFSFYMAIPVIGGAGFMEGMKAVKGAIPFEIFGPLGISMAVTVVVALVSMKILFTLVKRIKLDIFGYYTILLGIAGLLFLHL